MSSDVQHDSICMSESNFQKIRLWFKSWKCFTKQFHDSRFRKTVWTMALSQWSDKPKLGRFFPILFHCAQFWWGFVHICKTDMKQSFSYLILVLLGCKGEREIKFIGLFGDRGHQGPYSPYEPCNHNLYIRIIIFPHIDNPQSTGYN